MSRMGIFLSVGVFNPLLSTIAWADDVAIQGQIDAAKTSYVEAVWLIVAVVIVALVMASSVYVHVTAQNMKLQSKLTELDALKTELRERFNARTALARKLAALQREQGDRTKTHAELAPAVERLATTLTVVAMR